MAEADAMRARLAKLPLILKRFRQTVLTAACSGETRQTIGAAGPSADAVASLPDAHSSEPQSSRAEPGSVAAADLVIGHPGLLDLPVGWSRMRHGRPGRMPERALTYGVVKLGDSRCTDGIPTATLQ